MPNEKIKFLQVTTTRYYVLPMIDKNELRSMGGHQDWFDKKYLNGPHASRDANELGESIILDKVEVVDELPKL